jgi:hypothetical protein
LSEVNLDIIQAMDHERLFAPWFRGGQSWNGWRTVLKAAYALPLSDQERAFLHQVAEREPPSRRVRELWVVAGRRAGKDSIASLITAHAAVFFEHRDRLRPGERALCACLACDRDQAKIILNYTRSYFTDIPPLKAMISRETRFGFELSNGVDVAISTNSFRNVRGRPILCAVMDELAFYKDETTANPDVELYNALRPGMATLAEDALLVAISTPYAKRGLLYRKFRENFGKNSDDVLVIRAPSILHNPTLDQSIITAALEEDPSAAEAEWNAVWRSDIEGYVNAEAVDAVVAHGRYELPPVSGTAYVAFVDPSGGSSDSMTLAIGHRDQGGCGILDCLREAKPPFSPEVVVTDFARTLKRYGVVKICGDRWGGSFVQEPFRLQGIDYQIADRPKSDYYRDLLPLINSGRVELLDNKKLIAQLCGLERRVSRVGKDSIDHGPGAHDDLINSAAASLVLVCASGASLGWQREALASVPMPDRVDLVYAVFIASDDGMAAVTYWGARRLGLPLCLLDCESGPLTSVLMHCVFVRLAELSETCPARLRVLYTTGKLAAEMERLVHKCRIEIIDRIVDDDLLEMSVGVHIANARVRLTDVAMSKSFPLTFLTGSGGQDDDPLRLSFLCGCALAFSSSLRLGRAA